MLYGKPIKHVRHVDEDSFTIELQRFYVHRFWSGGTGGAARSDGDDLQDTKLCPLGSKITKHKLEILVTPETIEPQQIYMGRIKLSFNDVLARPIAGGLWGQGSFGDESTESFTADTTPISPQLYPASATQKVLGYETANQEIGGAASGFGISEWKLDDNIRHYINLKKITVFDQRPLMGERWQRIPSKVKRINPFTFYGLFLFNDSVRGGTAADTQVTVNIKSYYEELAI